MRQSSEIPIYDLRSVDVSGKAKTVKVLKRIGKRTSQRLGIGMSVEGKLAWGDSEGGVTFFGSDWEGDPEESEVGWVAQRGEWEWLDFGSDDDEVWYDIDAVGCASFNPADNSIFLTCGGSRNFDDESESEESDDSEEEVLISRTKAARWRTKDKSLKIWKLSKSRGAWLLDMMMKVKMLVSPRA
jgi:hypothetical protein